MKPPKRLLALLTALVLLACLPFATAEEAALGSVPEMGLILPLTQEDVDAGFRLESRTIPGGDMPDMHVIVLNYTDQQLLEKYRSEYASLATDERSAAILQKELEDYCTYPAGQIMLLDAAYYAPLTADGTPLEDAFGFEDPIVLGENEGFLYVGFDCTGVVTSEDAERMASITAVMTRARELLSTATFQPIVKAEPKADPFPVFTTTDLSGNPVTSDLFAEKDLTVVNIWGTFCGPCIDEMDELAAWSASMPENAQLVGLVSDLYSLEDAETLEMANQICESTGASNYLHLVTSADFDSLMAALVGVPTTYFVDSTGAVVGQPIVGADVPACMAFVEEYLNAQ